MFFDGFMKKFAKKKSWRKDRIGLSEIKDFEVFVIFGDIILVMEFFRVDIADKLKSNY